MLDEIINYVQSLQNQVEVFNLASMGVYSLARCHSALIQRDVLYVQFLSMKLASVNPMLCFGAHYDDYAIQTEVG